jgi:hypothetical protein
MMAYPALLDNPLHELEVTSHCRKFFSSDPNFLKLNVERIVLVVFNPEKEFHTQNLVGCHTLTIKLFVLLTSF